MRPRDWCRGNFTVTPNFPLVGLRTLGDLMLGFGPNFYVVYVLLQFFGSTRNLWDAWADQRKNLHGG